MGREFLSYLKVGNTHPCNSIMSQYRLLSKLYLLTCIRVSCDLFSMKWDWINEEENMIC